MLLDFPAIASRTGWLPFGSGIGGPGIRILRSFPEIVHRMHQRGYKVFVWTVNTAEDLELVLNLQVEGIITDTPDFVLGRLRALGRRT
jgi:glycerophosphoryl diester phosphodiesterase